MKKNIFAVASLVLAASLCGIISQAHAAEEDVSKVDPPRWYQPDDTPKERYSNLVKEAKAAYGEAQQACKGQRGKDGKRCRNEAKAALKEDMARAKRIFKDYSTSLQSS